MSHFNTPELQALGAAYLAAFDALEITEADLCDYGPVAEALDSVDFPELPVPTWPRWISDRTEYGKRAAKARAAWRAQLEQAQEAWEKATAEATTLSDDTLDLEVFSAGLECEAARELLYELERRGFKIVRACDQ